MPGPAPTHRPTFTPAQRADCERLVRQHNAPQLQVARARLALLLHDEPGLDHATAARRLGRHPNWVRGWRRTWAAGDFLSIVARECTTIFGNSAQRSAAIAHKRSRSPAPPSRYCVGAPPFS